MNGLSDALKQQVGQSGLTAEDVNVAIEIANVRWDQNFHTDVAMACAFFSRVKLSPEEQKIVHDFVVGTPEQYGACVATLSHIKQYVHVFCLNRLLEQEG